MNNLESYIKAAKTFSKYAKAMTVVGGLGVVVGMLSGKDAMNAVKKGNDEDANQYFHMMTIGYIAGFGTLLGACYAETRSAITAAAALHEFRHHELLEAVKNIKV